MISAKPFKIPQALPAKGEKLGGILKDVKDDNDERFNYIIKK